MVAVHELGGEGQPLLVSHATGFHGRCYLPLAHELAGQFRCTAFDYRGHGDTPQPDAPVDWERYADDAHEVARALVARHGQPIDAFGHSMGGACLLMVALREPGLFRRLVVFEPIVFPPGGLRPDDAGGDDPDSSPMVQAARRRRAVFPSFQAAIDNYSAKPPLNGFTPEAMRAYVEHGFRQDADGVHLKCTPEVEAATFATGSQHRTWEQLHRIETPTVVVSGRVQPFQPATFAAPIAELLPHDRLVQADDLDHFGPMTHPDRVAQIIIDALPHTPSLR
ncbi:MAG: hypothetical protein RLZ14_1501 [Actinomycetota bacterium]